MANISEAELNQPASVRDTSPDSPEDAGGRSGASSGWRMKGTLVRCLHTSLSVEKSH